MGDGDASNSFRERLERELDELQFSLKQRNEANKPPPPPPEPPQMPQSDSDDESDDGTDKLIGVIGRFGSLAGEWIGKTIKEKMWCWLLNPVSERRWDSQINVEFISEIQQSWNKRNKII